MITESVSFTVQEVEALRDAVDNYIVTVKDPPPLVSMDAMKSALLKLRGMFEEGV